MELRQKEATPRKGRSRMDSLVAGCLVMLMLMLGIIIMIHEFRTILFLKLNGIGVIEFSLGMGPRLFSFEEGRHPVFPLRYYPVWRLLHDAGEDEGITDESLRLTTSPYGPGFPWWPPDLCLIFILAFGLSMVLIGITGMTPPGWPGLMDGYPAKAASMEAGDMIKSINGRKVHSYVG